MARQHQKEMGMLRHVARFIVRSYPRRWRDRYEVEICSLIDDSGATWRHALDLVVGCGSEWIRLLAQPGTDRVFRHPYALMAAVFALGLVIDLVSFGAVRLWQAALGWAPSATVADASQAIPLITLVATVLSGIGGRRIRLRVIWIVFALTMAGAILDRFRPEPTGLMYGIRSMLWVGIVLSWDEVRRGPYRSRPPLGLGS